MKLVKDELLKDMVLGIDLALEKIPDECDCQAYTESDTNATIHQEEVCQVFTRYHLEAVKSEIEKILQPPNTGLQADGAWDCPNCKKPNINEAKACWFCEQLRPAAKA